MLALVAWSSNADAWVALEKRLECFQHMVLSELPKSIAVVYGNPDNADGNGLKVAATIRAAHKVGSVRPVQRSKRTSQATVAAVHNCVCPPVDGGSHLVDNESIVLIV